MAEKRPVCQYGGTLEELRTGDTLPGGGSGGSATLTKSISMPGPLVSTKGTVRWYPPVDVNLVNAVASVSTPATGRSINLDINKNGISIRTLSIGAGDRKSTQEIPSNLVLLTTDYLTLDVDQVGIGTPGSDLYVQIQYTKA